MNRVAIGRPTQLILKFGISSLIIMYLFSRAPLSHVFEAFLQTQLSFILLAILLYTFEQVLSSYRWKLLAALLGFQKRFIDLVAYFFTGMFFNLFMLGSIGGDVVRAYYLAGKSQRIIPAGYTIFTERFTGALALITILTTALLIPAEGFQIPSFIRWPIVGGTAFIWLSTIFMPRILRLFPIVKRWGEKIHLEQMKVFWDQPRLIVRPLLISFAIQTLFSVVAILVGTGFGLHIPLQYFFIFVPLGDLLGVLPISFNGIGVREGCYVYFLHQIGVPTPTAVAFSFLCTGVVWSVSLLGGLVYLFGTNEKRMRALIPDQSLKDIEAGTSLP